MARRDLGTTGEGTLHFWHQRLSGFANLFLGTSFVAALSFYGRDTHGEVLAWFSQPWMVGLTLAFIISALWHMRLGLNVIIDDYIHVEGLRLFYRILNMFLTSLFGLLAILALLQLLLGEAMAPANLMGEEARVPETRAPDTSVPETRAPLPIEEEIKTP